MRSDVFQNTLFPEPLGALECWGLLPFFRIQAGSAVQRGVKTSLLSELREQVEHGSGTIPGEPIKPLCPELAAQDIKWQLASHGWAEVSYRSFITFCNLFAKYRRGLWFPANRLKTGLQVGSCSLVSPGAGIIAVNIWTNCTDAPQVHWCKLVSAFRSSNFSPFASSDSFLNDARDWIMSQSWKLKSAYNYLQYTARNVL